MNIFTEAIQEIITINPDGQLFVVQKNIILKNGIEAYSETKTKVLEPGDSLAGQSADVVAHASVAFTPERVAAKAAQKAAEKIKVK